MTRKYLLVIIAIVTLLGVFALSAHAAVVGRFTLIKGQVDLLKGGKVPGIPAKVQDGVEPGDVIRTKSGAKAQLSMVDASVITLAPESRLAVADYHYDPAGGSAGPCCASSGAWCTSRWSTALSRPKSRILMETHTATIGVRGTDWYTLLGPNSTGVYLPGGILGVSSQPPRVSGSVRLQSGQFTQLLPGPATLHAPALTPEILQMLEKLMDTGLTEGGLGFGPPAGGTGTQYQTPLTLPGSPDQKLLQQTIPPVLVPQHQTAAPVQSAPALQPAPSGTL